MDNKKVQETTKQETAPAVEEKGTLKEEAKLEAEAPLATDASQNKEEVIYTFSGILNTGQHSAGNNMRINLDKLDISEFEKNPIMLYSHDSQRPIGKFSNIQRTEEGLVAQGNIFAAGGGDSKKAVDMIESGLMTGISVGIQFNPFAMKEEKTANGSGYRIDDGYLLESSVVALPADTNARIKQSIADGASLLMNGKNFATFGAEYKFDTDKNGKCFMRFCTPIRLGLSAKSTEEEDFQRKKEAGVLPPDAKPKSFSFKYGFGLTADQMKKKDAYIERGIPEKDATEIIMKETKPETLSTEPQTTPPSPKVLKMSATHAPAPVQDPIGDMKNGPSKVKFLGHTININDRGDNVMDTYYEAIGEATRKQDFNGKAFTSYAEALRYDPKTQEQQAALSMAMRREEHLTDELKFKNDGSILRRNRVKVKVNYRD